MPSTEILDAYRSSRLPGTDTSVLCHAPFVSLNFEQSGRVTSCCYNRAFVLGTYPEQSVRQIWTSSSAQALREAFLRNEEAPGCGVCFHQLEKRNFAGTMMQHFDAFSRDAGYRPHVEDAMPRVLEFELSNTCNLECVMCAGHWSSSIRAKREKLPPLRSPYDRAFVDQLEEFLPSVSRARFLGGEPFLIKRYYEIWTRIRDARLDTRLTVTTNATIIPERVRELLEALRFDVMVSLDALTPAVYEAIRRNARFPQVMTNVDYLLGYTRRKSTKLSLAVCPMTHNWRDLPNVLGFCEEKELQLGFNTVLQPSDASLGGLAAHELAEVITYLEKHGPDGDAPWTRHNRGQWEGLLSQLRGWRDDKLAFSGRCSRIEARVRALAEDHQSAGTGWTAPEGFDSLISQLVLSRGIACERASSNRVDVRILPPTPIPLWQEDAAPSEESLLLATLFLCRCLDAAEGQTSGVEARSLQDWHRLLLKFLAARSDSGSRDGRDLARWMGERIRWGEGEALVRWMRELLLSLDVPSEDWRTGRGQERLGVDEALAKLKTSGLSQPGLRRAELGLRYLVAKLRGEGHAPLSTASEGATSGGSGGYARLPPLQTLDDIRGIMAALYLFHLHYEPAGDHEAFRRRTDSCVAVAVESGRVEPACRALEGFDLAGVYGYVAHASDAEFERSLDAFR